MQHKPLEGRHLSVLSLCETEHEMWLGTDVGLFCYDLRTDSVMAFLVKTAKGERPDRNIYDIRQDTSQRLWVTSYERGVFCISADRRSMTRYPLPGDERRVGYILTSRSGDVWELGAWGDPCLCRFNPEKARFEVWPLEADGKSLFVSGLAIADGQDGYYYIGNDVGCIIRFRPDSHQAELTRLPADVGIIRTLTFLSPDQLLVGSDAGLTLYNISTHATQRLRSAPTHATEPLQGFVYATLIDREQTLW